MAYALSSEARLSGHLLHIALQLISAVDFCCVFLLDESQRHCIAGGIQRTPAGAATCANRVDGAAAKDSRANQK